MAHLTCLAHHRRVHLSDSIPTVVQHRSDLSRCEHNAPVTIGGNVYIPSLLLRDRDMYPAQLKSSNPHDFELPPTSRKDRPRKKSK